MTSATLFHHATILGPKGPLEGGWLRVEGGRIESVGRGERHTLGEESIDAKGRILAPGLIDIHVHGALGHDTMDATPTALRTMARFYAQHGVTAFLATTASAPAEALEAAVRNVAQVMASGTGGATLLGAHLEGPYLSPERHGCHDLGQLRIARPEEYLPLLDGGAVRLITVAPELPHSEELIRHAVSRGVRVAAGHTCATYEEMRLAVGWGVTQISHLFNGMEPLHHRRPGVIGSALTFDALFCELIADNVHVLPPVLNLALRAAGPERIVLITDAISGTGMPDGVYALADTTVYVRDGVARTADGSLAGSTLTLERGVANMMAASGLSDHVALSMASRSPAVALGLARKGSLAVDMDADLVLLEDDLSVALTMVAGQVVYRRED